MEDKFDINEAINHARDKATELKDCECGEWHEQLADWLEELKKLRNTI